MHKQKKKKKNKFLTPYIIQNENALYYECNFSCDNAIFIRIDSTTAFFITDARYTHEASQIVQNAKVVDGQRSLISKAQEIIKEYKPHSIIFDPSDWSAQSYLAIKESLDIPLVSKPNFSQIKREIKSKEEIEVIKKAVKEGEKAFDRFCEFVSSHGIGMSEEELHFNAELLFKDKGRLGLSFSPIVAINENSAKPHALPAKKILQNGDLLLLDAGITYQRYCSDRTRTSRVSEDFDFTKEQSFSNQTRQKVYDTVLRAQEAAIKKAKPGVRASDIDKAARSVIHEAGFGEFFIHSTGHGVGLDIHELPAISQSSQSIIEENMVFTVEPGIYLSDDFGVRIEDMVVVTSDGVEVL